MNGIRILCDTNVLIHLLNNNADVVEFLDEKYVIISSITELELYGKQMSPAELEIISSLIDSCIVVDLIQPIKKIVIQLKQKYNIKLPDAIIAATSIYYDVPLVTFDTNFQNIEEIKLILFKL
jgi:predicted nucleic acid-binding protein